MVWIEEKKKKRVGGRFEPRSTGQTTKSSNRLNKSVHIKILNRLSCIIIAKKPIL